jgi:hypothetical protein
MRTLPGSPPARTSTAAATVAPARPPALAPTVVVTTSTASDRRGRPDLTIARR